MTFLVPLRTKTLMSRDGLVESFQVLIGLVPLFLNCFLMPNAEVFFSILDGDGCRGFDLTAVAASIPHQGCENSCVLLLFSFFLIRKCSALLCFDSQTAILV